MNEGFVSTKLGLPSTTRAAEEVMIARNILVGEAEGKRFTCAMSPRGGQACARGEGARRPRDGRPRRITSARRRMGDRLRQPLPREPAAARGSGQAGLHR